MIVNPPATKTKIRINTGIKTRTARKQKNLVALARTMIVNLSVTHIVTARRLTNLAVPMAIPVVQVIAIR
jgi:hypothetical protein